jgi:hypothetical protein
MGWVGLTNQFCPFELSPLSFELSTKEHPMKKILTTLAAAFLLLPAAGFGGYAVYLKSPSTS